MKLIAASACAAVLTTLFAISPATAQSEGKQTGQQNEQGDANKKSQNMAEQDKAAEEMINMIYVYETTPFRTPTSVVAKLIDLGYTNIHDFDVEYNSYEVEATNMDGNEVELTIDPITGAITDIDNNWF